MQRKLPEADALPGGTGETAQANASGEALGSTDPSNVAALAR
jgi:hypothetical protein